MNTMEIFKKNQLINEELMKMVAKVQPSEKAEAATSGNKILDMVTELCAELIDGPKCKCGKESNNG